MKKFFLFFLLLMPFAAFGQLKVPPKGTQDYFKSSHYELFFGYSRSAFLNSLYATNSQKNAIKQGGGVDYELGMRLQFSVFMLSAAYFNSTFSSTDANLKDLRLTHRGGEFCANVLLLPQSMNSFSPYLGVGYSTGSLLANQEKTSGSGNNKQTTENMVYATKVENAVWKVGLMARYKFLSLSAEYKQSLDTKDIKAYSQYSITLGFSPHVYLNN